MRELGFGHLKNSGTDSCLSGVRVLAVDDSSDCRNFFIMLFQLYDADARVVSSASQAFDLFLQFQPQVLAIDIAMPAVDGFGLLESIRRIEAQQHLPPTPAIAVTALVSPIICQKAYQTGYQALFPKPVDIDTFVATIAYHTQVIRSCQ